MKNDILSRVIQHLFEDFLSGNESLRKASKHAVQDCTKVSEYPFGYGGLKVSINTEHTLTITF